jgi:hypothetical protein
MTLPVRAFRPFASTQNVESNQPIARLFVLVVLFAATVLCAAAPTAFATTYVVTPSGTTNCKSGFVFYSIQSAVTAAPAGSTIYICPGTYAEQVTISKGLTLTGVSANGSSSTSAAGAFNPVIVVPAGGIVANTNDLDPNGTDPNQPTAAQILVTNGASVSLNNITVDGSNNGLSGCGTDLVGIYYQNASGTVNHVVTRFQELDQSDFGCQDGLAIYVQSGYNTAGTATVTIENSSVHDYDKNGITADGSGTSVTITGNYVMGIGPTTLIAQNGIQVSDGATGKVSNNTVSDNVYTNTPDCAGNNSCTGSSAIILFDSGGTSALNLTVSGNTVSDNQFSIVAYTDLNAPADYNTVTSNKITYSQAAGPYPIDGIDMCSNHNTVSSNTVFSSSGAGVHLDSSCGTTSNPTGSGSATSNTVNEACAGVLLGSNGGAASSNSFYNVVETTLAGDTCPAGSSVARKSVHLRPHPKH